MRDCVTHHVCDCIGAERDRLRAEVERLKASYGWLDERFPEVKAEVARLTDGIRSIAGRRCLCEGHLFNPPHGGPCCGVAGGRCVTCEARSLLDVDGDDGEGSDG